jgi:hypothetical protein
MCILHVKMESLWYSVLVATCLQLIFIANFYTNFNFTRIIFLTKNLVLTSMFNFYEKNALIQYLVNYIRGTIYPYSI